LQGPHGFRSAIGGIVVYDEDMKILLQYKDGLDNKSNVLNFIKGRDNDQAICHLKYFNFSKNSILK